MGIRRVIDMNKAKYLGISWQAIALIAATVDRLDRHLSLPGRTDDPERVFLEHREDNARSLSLRAWFFARFWLLQRM